MVMRGLLPGEQTNTLRACDELVKIYRRVVQMCNCITLTSCKRRGEPTDEPRRDVGDRPR
jgi:hypothetical protein